MISVLIIFLRPVQRIQYVDLAVYSVQRIYRPMFVPKHRYKDHIRTVQVIWCAAHTEHLQRVVQIKVFIARLHNI